MVTNYIRHEISKASSETLFFSRDFLNLGSRGAVDACLIRMVKKGFLRRLANGVFVRYDCKKDFSAADIGRAKAKRFNRSLLEFESESERCADGTLFSLGRATSFETSQGRCEFKSISSRRLALTKLKTGEKIDALWSQKKEGVCVQDLYDVLSKLTRSEKEEILWSRESMPGWLSDLMHKSCNGKLYFPLKGQSKDDRSL